MPIVCRSKAVLNRILVLVKPNNLMFDPSFNVLLLIYEPLMILL
jgi:hypothetical protein